MFACKNDKKEPQGTKIESISFKESAYSVDEFATEGINLRNELKIAPASIADTCKSKWELSDPGIATISKDEIITPVQIGETTVTATVQGKSAKCTYIVKETRVTKITLQDISVAVGGEAALEYTTEPSMLPVSRLTLKSSKPGVAAVSTSGVILGIADGKAVISAQYGEVTASCTVTVGDGTVHVKSVTVTPAGIAEDVVIGSTKKLTATIEPSDASIKTVTWKSSNTSVATVSNDGTVTCKGEGSCTITATADGKSGTCSVTYSKNVIHVTSVAVTPSSYTEVCSIGATKKFTATVKPDNATDKSVSWKSSNTSVATVSSDGTVTCKGVGACTITATADGKSGTSSVTFLKVKVTSVTLSSTTIVSNVNVGATTKITATVKPDNATDKTVTWKSSNTSVATVSSDGTVTCKGVGSCTITATADGVSATCSVTYNKIKVTSVTVAPSEIQAIVSVGATRKLRADVLPTNATDKTVTSKSSNTSVATVSSDGTVTCKGVGSCTITATADGVSGTCSITYNQEVIHVESVTMSRSSAKVLTAGGSGVGSIALTATVKPDNATYKTVTWSSSNTSLATVSSSGVVVGKKEGTVVITATADGKSATCTVTVQAAEYMRDCQGNTYLSVKIGGYWWMAENLRCDKYDTESERAGVYLPAYSYNTYDPQFKNAMLKENWNDSHPEYYEDLSSSQIAKLGYLYNWGAAVGLKDESAVKGKTGAFSGNRQGICPNGWYLPSSAEWRNLIETVGGSTAATKLKTASGWYDDGNGTDEYFFSLLPSGYSGSMTDRYDTYLRDVGQETGFWLPIASDSNNAYDVSITNESVGMSGEFYALSKLYCRPVRCVRKP